MSPRRVPAPRLDQSLLVELMLARIAERRISQNQAMRECGLSHSTMTRLLHGAEPSASTLIRLMTWLGRHDVREFTTVGAR